MLMSSLAFLLLILNLHGTQTSRTSRVKDLTSRGVRLPKNIVFLHGGKGQRIYKEITNGISKSRIYDSLGPGLYTTQYQYASVDSRGSRSQASSWRDNVWGAGVSSELAQRVYPFVLHLQLSDDTRFAIAPTSVRFGSTSDWFDDPRRKRCMEDFDVLFLTTSLEDEDEDETCSAIHSRAESDSLSECELIPQEVLVRLMDAGCIYEYKINPEREALTQLVLVANNHRFASPDDNIVLRGALGAFPDVGSLQSWMCPHILAQQHEEFGSNFQRHLESYDDFNACNEALSLWSKGRSAPRCDNHCSRANSILYIRIRALVDALPKDNPLSAQIQVACPRCCLTSGCRACADR
eukprot:TRINITY_DN12918_c0_g1_i1.p1 TRINITY_DN12918_c0_g1~~TRINITY_DN12918_c0_g1_i1.p1  ORF type:complete len:351 (-),score=23.16 TRINITY_DN12918_c0_g1_i1:270-1322(-)